ncbi:MAG: RNA helicase [Phototrophicales bacterium]|nr:MAG: RNA helicase [Phototrophicales bacterium]RMG70308.1 MAG: DEAD/DEAH box helicase [Chloroflexota bacterium]
MTFQTLGICPEILKTLDYTDPTPIQTLAIPPILAGQDVIGQAQTGTGKTAAFTLPVLQQLKSSGLQVLILTPTRELAIQVSEAVYRYGGGLGIRVLPIYGGQPYERQERRLRKGVQVVVGTPGRTLDLIRRKTLDLRDVRYVILDEADEMLKMGFIEDIDAILSATNAKERQTLLFSATFSDDIRRLAQKYMHNPQHITVEAETVTGINVSQRYYLVQEKDKIPALCRLLEVENQQSTLIFTRTKIGAAELSEKLSERGYIAVAIHGDLSQQERERILGRFRAGDLTILVATDVIARGVDIPEVSHVINYDIPQLAIEYVHRIGRTGRAGRSGDAITLVTPRQLRQIKTIEAYTNQRISKAQLPTLQDVLNQRQQQFYIDVLNAVDAVEFADPMVDDLLEEGYSLEQIAAGLLKLLRGQMHQSPLEEIGKVNETNQKSRKRRGAKSNKQSSITSHEEGMVRLYMNIGKSNGLRPADVVYSVASKADIPGHVIGAIDIRHEETYLDVPVMHVDKVLKKMRNHRMRGRAIKVSRAVSR